MELCSQVLELLAWKQCPYDYFLRPLEQSSCSNLSLPLNSLSLKCTRSSSLCVSGAASQWRVMTRHPKVSLWHTDYFKLRTAKAQDWGRSFDLPWKKSCEPRQDIRKQRHHFADKGLRGVSYGFSISHIWMWELDHKDDWAPKNWHFQIVMLEKTLESHLDFKEIKPVNPKGKFIANTIAEAEAPILWSPDAKKTLMLGQTEGKGEGSGRGWDG